MIFKITSFFRKANKPKIYFLLFLLFTTISTSWNNKFIVIFSYLALIEVTLLSLVESGIFKGVKRLFFISILFSLFIYLFAASSINRIELWADEVNVLKFAESHLFSFNSNQTTNPLALTLFEQQTAFVWKTIVSKIPKEIMEFVYRIPIMIFHSLAAFIFTLAIASLAKFKLQYLTKIRSFLLICSYLLYFFNPLLFVYSIEFRNYGFSVLGVCLLLLIFLKGKLSSLITIPVLLLPGLNSIFHFFILFPFIIINSILKKRKLPETILLLGLLTFFFLFTIHYSVLPNWYFPKMDTSKYDFVHGINLLVNYFTDVFGGKGQTIAIITSTLIIIRLSYLKIIKVIYFSLTILLISTLLLISITGLFTGYPFFTTRHFIIVTPLLLFLITYPIVKLSKNGFHWSMIFLVTIVSIWIYSDIQMFRTENIFIKDIKGMKYVLSKAEKENREIIFNTGHLTGELRNYYLSSFYWYKERYPDVFVTEESTAEGAVQKFTKKAGSILYILTPNEHLPLLSPVGIITKYKNVLIAVH